MLVVGALSPCAAGAETLTESRSFQEPGDFSQFPTVKGSPLQKVPLLRDPKIKLLRALTAICR